MLALTSQLLHAERLQRPARRPRLAPLLAARHLRERLPPGGTSLVRFRVRVRVRVRVSSKHGSSKHGSGKPGSSKHGQGK